MLGIRCCHGSVRGSMGRDASSVQSNLSVTGNPEFRNFPTTTILSRLNQRRKVIQSSSNMPRVDDATMFCLHSFMPRLMMTLAVSFPALVKRTHACPFAKHRPHKKVATCRSNEAHSKHNGHITRIPTPRPIDQRRPTDGLVAWPWPLPEAACSAVNLLGRASAPWASSSSTTSACPYLGSARPCFSAVSSGGNRTSS